MGLRFELPARKKLVHETTVQLRWGDMDAMGHINNTLYFRFMEVARLEWLFSIGAGTDPEGQGPVIVNAFCNFLRQLEYPGELKVTVFVAAVGRSSFDSYHTMVRTDQPEVVYAEGGARIVWTDFKARKSVPLPDRFGALLA